MKLLRFIFCFGITGMFFFSLPLYALQEEIERASVTGLEFDKRMNGEQVLSAIEPLRKELQECSAAFFRDGDLIGYGIVMGDGNVLTKASLMEVREGVSVRIGESVFVPEKWSEVDEDHDLVLLKVKGRQKKLKKQGAGGAQAFSTAIAEPGMIVVSNGATTRTKRRARMGIISAQPHSSPWPGARIPYLGVSFDEDDSCFVAHVEKGSPAEQSGLCEGDVIVSLAGYPISSLEDVGDQIDRMDPGVPCVWNVSREGKVVEISLVPRSRLEYLGEKEPPDKPVEEGTSKRRHGFPRVIQHDTSLLPVFMGGPLLDLKGKIVGMNISRVNRAETYALPASDVLAVYRRLCTW